MTARALPLVLLLAACSESALTPPRPGTTTVRSALEVPAEYLPTPYGWYHPSCIHHVPKGTTVDQKNAPRCEFPRVVVDPRGPSEGTPPPSSSGWQIDTEVVTSAPAIHMTSVFQVPAAPSMHDGQLDYFFPGMCPTNGQIILQPVLQYGFSPAGGGEKWGIASWSCDTETGGTCGHSDLFDSAAGDVLLGTIDGTNCTGQGNCDWAITTTDLTNGATTTLNTTGDSHSYVWLFTGVLEAYSVARCADYPANGSEAFSNVLFTDPTGASLSSGWKTTVWDGANPSNCPTMNATFTDTSALLVFSDKTLPVVSLTPPDGPVASGMVAVTASATAGGTSTLSSLTISQQGTTVATGATSPLGFSFNTTTVPNGQYTFAAIATDADGAGATAYSTLSVLNPPTVTVTSQPSATPVVPVIANASPPLGTTVATIEIAYNGSTVASGPAPLTWMFDTSALTNGADVPIVATATDADGSKGSATLMYTVANPPAVTVNVPAVVSGKVDIEATATPAKGAQPSALEIDVDGQKVADNTGATTLQGTWDSTVAPNGSVHTVTAIATDSDNLSASAMPVSVTVKNVPALTFTAQQTSEAGKPYLINAAATAPVGTTVTSLTLMIDGEQAATSASSAVSFTWKTDAKEIGGHQLSASATASDGTVGTAAMTFNITKASGCGCDGGGGALSSLVLALLLLRRRQG